MLIRGMQNEIRVCGPFRSQRRLSVSLVHPFQFLFIFHLCYYLTPRLFLISWTKQLLASLSHPDSRFSRNPKFWFMPKMFDSSLSGLPLQISIAGAPLNLTSLNEFQWLSLKRYGSVISEAYEFIVCFVLLSVFFFC